MTDNVPENAADDAVAADVTAETPAKPETPEQVAAQEVAAKTADIAAGEASTAPLQAFGGPEVIKERHGQFGVHDAGDTTGFGTLTEIAQIPGDAPRPLGGWYDSAVEILEELLTADGIDPKDAIEKCVLDRGELTIFITRQHLPRVAKYLRDDQDLRFEMCFGVSAVNYPDDEGRELHGHYPFFSITHNRFMALEVTCPDSDPHIPTIVPIYPGNDWQEREAWDLMGIVFDGHPSLTRTAMPDDWVGHPQRKDYPLGGVPVEFMGATTPSPDARRSYN